jgi:CTP synthase (UTP-ammonia lyase)
MTSALKIGIISDLDDQRASQLMTDAALIHVGEHVSIDIQPSWLTTSVLANQDYSNDVLKKLDAVWAGPGDYERPNAAIEAIQYCREQLKPFFGT